MAVSWQLALAGALVGLSVGLTGMGGGALMTPILVLLFGVDPTAAVGSDLVASVAMKPVGAAVHQRAGSVRWELVRWLVPAGVPAAFAGAFLLHLLGSGTRLQERLESAIGVALLLAVLGMAARALVNSRRDGEELEPGERLRVRPLRTAAIGAAGGVVVGMTSVGSGSLIMVMLMLCYPQLRARDLVGTDLVQAVPLVGAAALGHLAGGDVRFGLTGWLLLGGLPAIYLGARLSTRAPNGVLKLILAAILLASGLKLWHVPTPATLAAAGAVLALAAAVSLRHRVATA